MHSLAPMVGKLVMINIHLEILGLRDSKKGLILFPFSGAAQENPIILEWGRITTSQGSLQEEEESDSLLENKPLH